MKNSSVASYRKNGIREAETVSLSALAEVTGETARQIQRLVAIGEIPRPKDRGEYNLAESVRGVVHYYRERASKFSEARVEAATRREQAEAEIAQINLAERKGEIRERVGLALKDVAIRVRGLYESIDYVPMKSPRQWIRDFEDAQLLEGFFDILTARKRKEPK